MSIGILGTGTVGRTLGAARVVKSLNTMSHEVMVEPSLVPGDHAASVCGDDESARAEVRRLLVEDFGWSEPIDLGPLSASRGTEAWLPLWTRLYRHLGTGRFNLRLVRADKS